MKEWRVRVETLSVFIPELWEGKNRCFSEDRGHTEAEVEAYVAKVRKHPAVRKVQVFNRTVSEWDEMALWPAP